MHKKSIPIIAVVLFSFAVYLNSLSNGFVYDNHFMIENNPWIKDIKHLPDIFTKDMWAFMGKSNYYRPIPHLSNMAVYHVFGPDPFGFHLFYLSVHAANAAIVYLIASMLIARPAPFAPLAAALLFAAHPVNTESVLESYAEPCFAFFFLLSVYSYMRATSGDRPSKAGYALSVFSFFLAMLSKETAIILPFMLMAYDLIKKAPPVPRTGFNVRLKRYMPYLVAAFFYFAIRLSAIGGFAPVSVYPALTGYKYAVNVLVHFAMYLEKLILPVGLNAYYEVRPVEFLTGIKAVASFVAALMFSAALYLSWRKNRAFFFCLLLIAVPLFPAFYLIRNPVDEYNTFAERYLYLPSAGFAVALAMSLSWAYFAFKPAFGKALGAAFLVLIAAYSAGTVSRNTVWKDDITLWSDTVRKSPAIALPRVNLGAAYKNKGLTDKAEEQYLTAIRLTPRLPTAHFNLANTYISKGLTDKAIAEYNAAIRLKPEYAEAHNNLGRAYMLKGQTEDAAAQFTAAVKIYPGYADAHFNLGFIYLKKGLLDEAKTEFETVLRLNPGDSSVSELLRQIAENRRGS
ncbi:MAG: tetratricopeptide repeat protein [Thermodesulfovibrionales bacterium]|nr:tetratricopeptide repeat protein [Thermodesulfovibrionales bacterium]